MTSSVKPQASETATPTPAPVAFDPAYESPATRRARHGASRAFREGRRSFEEERDARQFERAQARAAKLATSNYSLGSVAASVLATLPKEGASRKFHLQALASSLESALATDLCALLATVDRSRINAAAEWREVDNGETRKALVLAVLELYHQASPQDDSHDGTWTDAGSAHATARSSRHERARARLRAEDDRTRERAALLRLNQ